MRIEIAGVYKRYGKKPVLNGVNIALESGKCIGILGGNGSGKSTLLGILSGLIKADKGEFLADKQPIGGKNSPLTVGFVPQTPPLFEDLNAYDNLLLWYDKKTLQKELSGGFLSLLGVDGFLKTRVSKLSGGMKKRLSIGCAMASSPSIMLLDEPSAALDLPCKNAVASYLKVYTEAGNTVLLATHDLFEIALCDELYILKNGVAEPYVFDGDVRELEKRL